MVISMYYSAKAMVQNQLQDRLLLVQPSSLASPDLVEGGAEKWIAVSFDLILLDALVPFSCDRGQKYLSEFGAAAVSSV